MPVKPFSRAAMLAALVVSSSCSDAGVDLQFVDGAAIGVERVLEAHKREATGAERTTWLWGALGWTDPSGSYLYFTFHNYGTGFLFRRNENGTYSDVSPQAPADGVDRPAETRPLLMDADGNGFIDILHTGDETVNSVSLLNNGDGSWTFSRAHRLGWRGQVVDLNDDGYPDIDGYATDARNYGTGFRRRAINLSGVGFEITDEPVTLPEDAPTALRQRINQAADRFHMPRIYEFDEDRYAVAYGGAYGGEKFTYLVREGRLDNAGIPVEGTALPPKDLDGDGDLDIVVQWGPESGIYRQNGRGGFDRDEAGDAPTINAALRTGAYSWDVFPVDFDRDGDNDLVLSGKRTGTGYILENRSGVYIILHELQHVDGEAVWPADVDGDGDIDVVVAGNGLDRTDDKRDSAEAALFINQLVGGGSAPSPSVGGAASSSPVPPSPRDPAPLQTSSLEQLRDAVYALLSQAIGWGERIEVDNEALQGTAEILRRDDAAPRPEIERKAPLSSSVPAPDVPPEAEADVPADGPVRVSTGTVPFPDHDPTSDAWIDYVRHVGADRGRANDHALIGAVTDNLSQCATAILKAQAVVDADDVAANQYLASGRRFSEVFETLAWCEVPREQAEEWIAWGRGHLGSPDGAEGSRGEAIWWRHRWSRNNPANNYYHSFIVATSVYAMATGDAVWLDFLRNDRLPLMHAYYETTPEGGSREGTAYGESHREVFRIARLWRDYDGTPVVPQAFIDNSIRYWVHATAPGHEWVALIGDQTRTHGRTDGYHRDIIDNALQLAVDPEAIAMGRWQLSRLPAGGSAVFKRLVLRDYPPGGRPPSTLEYHAAGAGHFFARDGWDRDATFVYFTAGKHDEAHQQEDQGAFAVWADGRWQSTSDSPWTHGGIAQDVAYQNVVRFPSAENIHDSVSTLEWSRRGSLLRVEMDLTAAVGEPWQRTVEWRHGARSLRVIDLLASDSAVFGFEKPSDDDERAPYSSEASVVVSPTPTGFDSLVRW